jgi:hypothetical protein
VSLTRKNIEFAKRVFADRIGDPYIYGGVYDPFNLNTGADCSGSAGVFVGAALLGADSMSWTRKFTTEDFPGPFQGFRQVSQPDLLTGNYPLKVCIGRHGGGESSHMHVNLDGVIMESNGDHGTCTSGNGAMADDDPYWNTYFVYGGPIIEDGTPRTVVPYQSTQVNNVDTLFCDISEFQVPVDDSYPYQVLSIRVCDGTYQDHNFAANYAWMRRALDSGKLKFGIVYTYVRPSDWAANGQTVMAMIDANGGLHPRVALMLDVEAGGNPGGDQSVPINNLFNLLAEYAGSPARIIGYGNVSDLNTCWPTKPSGIRLIVAGYGANPSYPGKVAHQYTDGTGFGGGLPEGASPFGTCDMNSADGLSPDDFAAACGIGSAAPPPPPPQDQPVSNPLAVPKPQDPSGQTSLIFDQLLLRWDFAGNRTGMELLGAIGEKLGVPGCVDPLK